MALKSYSFLFKPEIIAAGLMLPFVWTEINLE
jgi:hypothetical protein